MCGKPERNLVKGDTRVRRFPLFWSIHSLEAVCPLPFCVLNNLLLASLEEEIYVYLRMQEYPPRQELHQFRRDFYQLAQYTVTALQNEYNLRSSYLAEKRQSHQAGTTSSVHRQSAGGYSRRPEDRALSQNQPGPSTQSALPPPSPRSPRAAGACGFRPEVRACVRSAYSVRMRQPAGSWRGARTWLGVY